MMKNLWIKTFDHNISDYIYIQWFSIMRFIDSHSKIYIMKYIIKYEIIDIYRIKCNIHLISKYENILHIFIINISIKCFDSEDLSSF